MTKSGVTHTNTATGEGKGQLTEEAGTKGKTPAPSSGQAHPRKDDTDHASGKSEKGAGGGR